jgi:glutathione S-transferase
MLIIWGRANSSNVQKVLWACGELNLEFQRIDIGGPFGGTSDPAYRSKNPNGRVPTIEDDGFVLWESNAILRYLAAGDPQHRLLPENLDRRARANIDRWMDWQLVSLGLTLRNLFLLLSGRAGASASPSQITAATDETVEMFRILEDYLSTQPYVGGNQFTLADIPVGISTHRWLELSIDRPPMPALRSWYDRISARAAFQSVRANPAG